jgi:hypothetical protein
MNIRGTIEITIGNRTVAGRTTIGTAVAIEETTGRGVLSLARSFGASDGKLKEAAAIIAAAMGGEETPASVLAAMDAGDQQPLHYLSLASRILAALIAPPKAMPSKKPAAAVTAA